MKAAGILFVTASGLALFLKRGEVGDQAGTWCWPGGKLEEGETSQEAAIREAREEAGEGVPEKLDMFEWTRTVTPLSEDEDLEFTTFICRIEKPFPVEICDESVGYSWSHLDKPPLPLHPGCQIAIDRFFMDELDVAQAMAAGRLASPQRYQNVWLFNIRITGTEAAYRASLKEFVWRDPDLYMNQRFLDRCNGLPVIWEHPPTATLNTKEFIARIIGTIFVPYLRPEPPEVWGIAKIYDEGAAQEMRKKQLSTSPTVVFKPGDNLKTKLEDGGTLLIEGEPHLLDHVAICAQGVWDKLEEPAGIETRVDSQPDADWGISSRRLDPEKLRRLDQAMVLLKLEMTCLNIKQRV